MTTPYALAADVIAAMPLSTRPDASSIEAADVDKVARITSLCLSTAEMINAELKGDFHRHPADDDAEDIEVIVNGRGSRTLHVHRGVISIESIDIRYSPTGEWEEVDADDYELASMFEAEDSARPYDHIHLARRSPDYVRGVRLTGHFGWSAPPERLVEMNVAWVRQHLAAGDSYSGAMQMPEGFIQTPRLTLPDDVRLFLTVEANRCKECYT
jgi:hypothetical protein